LIHVSTSGYLWIYTGAEHWINRAVLVVVVVVVVVYDDKPPLRRRWVSLSILIYRFGVYRVSADTEAGDSICGEATGLYRLRRLSSGLCYGDAGNDNLTLSTDVSGVAYGGRGNDYFSSTLGAGIWFYYGQEGDDTLVGNDEQTNMAGGRRGADTFVCN
jgi:hypothetical protein